MHTGLGDTYYVSGALGRIGGDVVEDGISGSDSDRCMGCSKDVKDGQSGIRCDVCERWYHGKCEGLVKKDLDYFGGSKAPWVCRSCTGQVKANREKVEGLEAENSRLMIENRAVNGKLEEILRGIREIKQEIKSEIKAELKEEIIGEVRREFREEMETMRDSDEVRKRECNLIVHGMREVGENERGRFADMVREHLGLGDIEVVEVNRLKRGEGKRDENGNIKPSPMLVRLKSKGQKWAVIGRAKNLRHCEVAEFKRVMIMPDLTLREREKDKRLRDELRHRRDEGEVGLFISRGQIKTRQNH